MVCPSCDGLPAEKRAIFSQLNRRNSLKLTGEKLAELVCGDEELVSNAIKYCQLEADALQHPDGSQLEQWRNQEQQLQRSIVFVGRNVGGSEQEQQESRRELESLRKDRANVLAKIRSAEAALARKPRIPTEEEVVRLINKTSDVLLHACEAESEEDLSAVRQLIEELTGGRIELYQMGERKAQRGWLQGRFHVRLLPYLIKQLGGCASTCEDGVEIRIDYPRVGPFGEKADQALDMYLGGMLKAGRLLLNDRPVKAASTVASSRLLSIQAFLKVNV